MMSDKLGFLCLTRRRGDAEKENNKIGGDIVAKLINSLTSGLTKDEETKLRRDDKLHFSDYSDNLYFRDLSEIARKAFNAGSGHELKLREDSLPAKASALHSSSMLACNFFDWINWSAGYEICIGGHKYSKAYFEVKIPTLARPKPTYANMDVMLVSNDGKRIAFIESKFTEHLSRAAAELYGRRFASAYAEKKDRYYDGCCAEEWMIVIKNWKEYARNGVVGNEAMKGYYNGIKQDICHLIAIGNLESSPAARTDFAEKNTKTFGSFDISGIEDFDFINLVYEPNKAFKEHELCGQFEKLCLEFFKDVPKAIKTTRKFCTYSELWNDKDNSSMLSNVRCTSSAETLKVFLERRYMRFSSVGK